MYLSRTAGLASTVPFVFKCALHPVFDSTGAPFATLRLTTTPTGLNDPGHNNVLARCSTVPYNHLSPLAYTEGSDLC